MVLQVFKGSHAKIYVNSVEVGYARKISASFDNSAKPYYEIGRQTAEGIYAGNHVVEGNIDQFWVNTHLLDYATVSGTTTKYNMELWVSAALSSTSGRPYAIISGATMKNLTLDMSTEDFSTNNVNFVAITMQVYGSGLDV